MDRECIVLLRPLQERELAIKTLLRRDVDIAIIDEPDSPLFGFADYPIPVENIRDFDRVFDAAIAFHQYRPIAGALTFLDYLLPTLGRINDALGLRGHSERTGRSCFFKHLQRDAFQRVDVPLGPKFKVVETLAEAAAAVDEIGYPVILKPSDRTGSRGVTRIDHASQLENAFQDACEEGWNAKVLVEAYMEGREISVETLTQDRITRIVSITDKFISPGSRFIEIGHCVPAADISASTFSEIERVVQSAIRAIGFNDIVAHTELRLTSEGPRLIEVNARVGGALIADMTLAATGINLYDLNLDLLLGKPVHIVAEYERHVALQAIIDGAGRYERTSVQQSVSLGNPMNRLAVRTLLPKGQLLTAVTHSNDIRGYIVAAGASRAAAEAALKDLSLGIGLTCQSAWIP